MKDFTGKQEEDLNKEQTKKQVQPQKQVKAKKQEAPPSLKKLLKETKKQLNERYKKRAAHPGRTNRSPIAEQLHSPLLSPNARTIGKQPHQKNNCPARTGSKKTKALVEFAQNMFDMNHPLVTGDEDENATITQAFAHTISLIFTFDGFTDEEVYTLLMTEVRKKYMPKEP
ncbi:MAG: hypothetical protein LUI85_12750 [Bacteroides sp.]|nr:hypothetical protein [Bacteroides sp.]